MEAGAPTSYPVAFSVDYPDRPLNRLTTGFRIFVAIPILIVAATLGGEGSSYYGSAGGEHWAWGGGGAAAVLVLTSFSDQPRILGAIEAGAVGYLLKDASSEDVVEGIRAAARGESPLDPRAARTVLNARAAPDPLAPFSPREREVLELLVAGLPNKLIARRLEISEKTVKSHLTKIFRELAVSDRTQAALWAERHGMRPRSH